MSADWSAWLARWTDAGLIDADTAARIRAFEHEHAGSTRLRWPVILALAFGGLMLGGGLLLFVAAHWDALSPSQRFTIVIVTVSGLHVGGAFLADRFPAMSSTLHAIGTIALGGGIALAGQIFNLDEHWPGGIMMWAAGAALAWAVLRDTPQLILTALLVPAWLGSEWSVATRGLGDNLTTEVLAAGLTLLALTYFTAIRPPSRGIAVASARQADRGYRRALFWVGRIAFLPAAACLAIAVAWHATSWNNFVPSGLVQAIGWCLAFGLPLLLASVLRRGRAWINGAAAVWVLVLVTLGPIRDDLPQLAWWAAGAIGLVAWGVVEGRSERVNMGAAIFALTVLTFYFSHVMDKLGRSASLVGLGLLFLAGGWALERVRRRFVQQARGAV